MRFVARRLGETRRFDMAKLIAHPPGTRETVRTAAKGIRKASKLNQAELAEKVGIETKYLSNIETGRRSPSFEKTVALAKALEVPMSALFSFDNDEADPKVLKRRIEAISQRLRHGSCSRFMDTYARSWNLDGHRELRQPANTADPASHDANAAA